jgi:hypothetical protein
VGGATIPGELRAGEVQRAQGEEAFLVDPGAGGEWRPEREALEEFPGREDVVIGFGGDGGFLCGRA